MKTLADTLRALAEGATEGPWRVGRQNGAPRDHLVDMGEPPKAPYFRMHKGIPASSIMRGSPAFGIVESDDAEAEEIAANAALIVALRNALPAILNALDEHGALTAREAVLTEHITEQITHVETRLQDGREMGAAIWRIALEDVARENRALLAQPSPGASQ